MFHLYWVRTNRLKKIKTGIYVCKYSYMYVIKDSVRVPMVVWVREPIK